MAYVVGSITHSWSTVLFGTACLGGPGVEAGNATTYSENENSSATFELRLMVASGGLAATSSPLFITVQLGGCGPAGC